jgi:hypothetical protein
MKRARGKFTKAERTENEVDLSGGQKPTQPNAVKVVRRDWLTSCQLSGVLLGLGLGRGRACVSMILRGLML